jgi:hypothetical protein
MPYFNFDLVIGEGFKNQGGMIRFQHEMHKRRRLSHELATD